MVLQGDVVAVVTAYDGDRGVNDEVEYWLEEGNSAIGGNGSFTINSTTGEVSVNVTGLDRETHHTYSLTVKVCDCHVIYTPASPPLASAQNNAVLVNHNL